MTSVVPARLALLLALALSAAACGGDAAPSTTAATTTAPPTTTTLPPTTTTTLPPTTTTTLPPTTTTTLPPTTTTTTLPPPVTGWDGAGVSEVALVFEFDPDLAALDMRATVRESLDTIGIDTDDDAAAVLTFDLTGRAASRSYSGAGRCYAGAKVSGTVTLSAEGLPDRTKTISYSYPAPIVIFSSDCRTDPDDAPYIVAFSTAWVPVLPAFWAGESAPALTAIIAGRVWDSTEDLPKKAAAMDAFRGLDPDLVDPADVVAGLEAAIGVVEYLVEEGITPHGADVAARRLLTAYSGTNYGVATADDVAQWREWLDGWEEEHA
ncbi:MAG: hypothetical protein KQH83_10365 [Actinobacteria bacterium]|nr:hypothetical protein [Actinomycetota bacterium]